MLILNSRMMLLKSLTIPHLQRGERETINKSEMRAEEESNLHKQQVFVANLQLKFGSLVSAAELPQQGNLGCSLWSDIQHANNLGVGRLLKTTGCFEQIYLGLNIYKDGSSHGQKSLLDRFRFKFDQLECI
jgi:hypothetical protein